MRKKNATQEFIDVMMIVGIILALAFMGHGIQTIAELIGLTQLF